MTRWVRFEAELRSCEPVAEKQHIATFHIAGGAPHAVAGQFVQFNLPEVFWPRPFSLLSWRDLPGGGVEFRTLFAEAGRGTRALARLAPGATLTGHGPLGRGFPPVSGPTWMVAGGYGIAPLLFAAEGAGALRAAVPAKGLESVLAMAPSDEPESSRTAAHSGGLDNAHIVVTAGAAAAVSDPVLLFYGAHSAASLWKCAELDRFHATLCTEDGSLGVRGTVLDAVRAALLEGSPQPAPPEGMPRPMLFACGPMGLLKAVAELAIDRGLQAFLSVETSMPCGIGVCRGCALPRSEDHSTEQSRYVMACESGPVFEARELDWVMEAACRI